MGALLVEKGTPGFSLGDGPNVMGARLLRHDGAVYGFYASLLFAPDEKVGLIVFGNVMSARLGRAKGKDFDTGNVMGPYLVTPDEVKDPYSLGMEAFVNGDLWSSGSSSGMRLSFEEVIEYISRSETLHACDFIASGTVGTGCGLELDRWIKPGDTVTLKVEKLGELSNPAIREP